MRPDPDDPYAVLGVRPDARPREIAAAFRARAKRLHPDVPRTGDAAGFMRARAAYDLINNPARRARHDAEVAARRAAAAQPRPAAWRYDDAPPDAPPHNRNDAASDEPHPWQAPREYDFDPHIPVTPRWWRVLPAWGWGAVVMALIASLSGGVAWLGAPPAAAPPPRPSTVAAVSPQVAPPAAPSADPAEPTPDPNLVASHYVLPAGDPATLWHRAPDGLLVAAASLPAFTGVEALRLLPEKGLFEVRAPGGAQGLVLAARLVPGGPAQAHRAFCIQSAGKPATNGEVFFRAAQPDAYAAGQGRAVVTNRSDTAAVMKLRDDTNATRAAIFIGPHGSATIEHLPDGLYRPEFASGDLWSRRCGVFVAGMRVERAPGFERLGQGGRAMLAYSLPIHPDDPAGSLDIPEALFIAP